MVDRGWRDFGIVMGDLAGVSVGTLRNNGGHVRHHSP